MKTFIVNLPHSHDRRQSILAECARFHLEAEVFPAVYGKDLTEAELREAVDARAAGIFGPAEIGCCLSHLGIYRAMLERNIPLALVLEDDAVFLHDPRPVLDGLAALPAAAPEVHLLSRYAADRYVAGIPPRSVGGQRFFHGWRAFGNHGYVVNQAAAAALLAFQTPMQYACDWWKVFQNAGVVNLYLCESELIGLQRALAEASLIGTDRPAGQRHRRKRYVLRQTPLRHTIRYYCRKLWYGRRIRQFPAP